MNSTAAAPHATAESAPSNSQLATPTPSLLDEFMADLEHAPDPLLRQAMGILAAHRQSVTRFSVGPPSSPDAAAETSR